MNSNQLARLIEREINERDFTVLHRSSEADGEHGMTETFQILWYFIAMAAGGFLAGTIYTSGVNKGVSLTIAALKSMEVNIDLFAQDGAQAFEISVQRKERVSA